MIKQFTPHYIRNHKGCYDIKQVNNLSFITKESINILDIINSEIKTKDKCWFVFKKCDLTITQKKELSYLLAESVASIYNEKYPNDNRINDCIRAIKDFNKGLINNEQLWHFRSEAMDAKNAAAVAVAVAAAAAVADAAFAAAAFAAADAAAADAVAAAAAAFAAAAFAAAAAAKKENKVIKILINFINQQE